jgi:hypothetical protein
MPESPSVRDRDRQRRHGRATARSAPTARARPARGFYRVEVGALAGGWRDLGVHWVDGTGVADLGTVALARPGALRIDTPYDLEALELVALRADLPVRALELAPWTREVELPAGRWRALWKRGEHVVARDLVLAAGVTTVLTASR